MQEFEDDVLRSRWHMVVVGNESGTVVVGQFQ